MRAHGNVSACCATPVSLTQAELHWVQTALHSREVEIKLSSAGTVCVCLCAKNAPIADLVTLYFTKAHCDRACLVLQSWLHEYPVEIC